MKQLNLRDELSLCCHELKIALPYKPSMTGDMIDYADELLGHKNHQDDAIEVLYVIARGPESEAQQKAVERIENHKEHKNCTIGLEDEINTFLTSIEATQSKRPASQPKVDTFPKNVCGD